MKNHKDAKPNEIILDDKKYEVDPDDDICFNRMWPSIYIGNDTYYFPASREDARSDIADEIDNSSSEDLVDLIGAEYLIDAFRQGKSWYHMIEGIAEESHDDKYDEVVVGAVGKDIVEALGFTPEYCMKEL